MRKIMLLLVTCILLCMTICGCGNASTPADDFQYSISDNSVYIKGYLGSDSSIVIPERIEGKYVISISSEAFNKNNTIESVYIPDSVRYIGKYAFNRCENLKDIRLSDKLEEIYDSAFARCTSLVDIDVPESVTYLGKCVFKDSANLKSVTMSESLYDKYKDKNSNQSFEDYRIFEGCDNVKINGTELP